MMAATLTRFLDRHPDEMANDAQNDQMDAWAKLPEVSYSTFEWMHLFFD